MTEPNEGLLDLVAKLKEILLGPKQGGQNDDSKQSEQVLHFVRRQEPEED
jgi:hypothetical protein